MNIQPIGNRLVVQLVKKSSTSASGFIVSTQEKDEQTIGIVVAIGGGQGVDENITTLGINVGDKILFAQYGAQEVMDEHNPDTIYKLVSSKDVLAILK